ncbi:MAG: helix-turn-helix transcriptional regulator [Lachnospiraceae bacterium]|nr:helix-turn-helix transcriptional regulator [Lachnospiraceae bacterium]
MKSKFFYRATGKDKYYNCWHSNNDVTIIYMHSDGGSIVFGDQTYPINKGRLFLIPANHYHYTLPSVADTYERSKVFFPVETFKKILSLFPPSLGMHFKNAVIYSHIPEEIQPKLDILFQELQESYCLFGNDFFSFPSCLSGILRLLGYLKDYELEKITSASDSLSLVVDYINKHIHESITLDDICQEVHVNKCYLCRLFKKNMNTTIMNYILQTRIIFAQTMLSSGNLAISEISENCGFSSISYFCRVFKAATGQTPLQYKRNAHTTSHSL